MSWLPKKWDNDIDVIIVGTGFAGLAAAIEAYDAGASVTILEKRPVIGGNSIIASGGVNAVDPRRQILQDIEDSADLHFKQTFDGGGCLGDPEKIQFMVDNALIECVNWLEKIGVTWPERIVQGFGALWPRTHLPATYKKYQRGAALIHAELDQVRKRNIPLLLKHSVTRIIREKPLDEKVLGVEIETDEKKSFCRAKKALVLTSGGFGANIEMVADHDRRLANTPTDNHSGATGECIKMAQDVGADVVGMDYIQCVPMAVRRQFKAYFFVITSKEIRDYPNTDSYKIFVNKEGNRFVREDARRDDITFASLAQQPFEPMPTVNAETIEELEKKLKIPKGNLAKTIDKYDSYCDAQRDPEFDKLPYVLIPCRTAPFIVETKAPGRHHTMGGLKVKGSTGQVVDRWGKIIPQLYAAGEVTGGFHGLNRLGHNATPECIVFGRAVGKRAAAE
jgi:urocanate reductase